MSSGCLARLRDDGCFGTEQHDPSQHRELGVAELFRPGAEIKGIGWTRRVSPS